MSECGSWLRTASCGSVGGDQSAVFSGGYGLFLSASDGAMSGCAARGTLLGSPIRRGRSDIDRNFQRSPWLGNVRSTEFPPRDGAADRKAGSWTVGVRSRMCSLGSLPLPTRTSGRARARGCSAICWVWMPPAKGYRGDGNIFPIRGLVSEIAAVDVGSRNPESADWRCEMATSGTRCGRFRTTVGNRGIDSTPPPNPSLAITSKRYSGGRSAEL